MNFNPRLRAPEFLPEVDACQRWRARSWRFRLEYRYNVVRGLVLLQISLRSCWFALNNADRVLVVQMRAPHRGMLMVCPALQDEYVRMVQESK